MTASYIGIAKHGSHKMMRLVIFGCNVICRMWIIFMAFLQCPDTSLPG